MATNAPAATDAHQMTMLVREAIAKLEQRREAEAEALLTRALHAAPQNPTALQLLGLVRKAQGRLAEAEEYHRRSLSVDPTQAQVHHNLANLLQASGRIEEAIAEEHEAIRLKPNYADAHLGLAIALSRKGDHAASEQSYRQVLRLQPNYLDARLGLGGELCSLDRPKEAERVLRQALALGIRQPAQAAAFEHNLAVALKQQSKFMEALASFDRAEKLDPQLPALDYMRGSTFLEMGRLEEALQWFRKAVARDPSHADAVAHVGLVSAQLSDFAAADRYGREALSLQPENAVALTTLAIVDIESGRNADAEAKLRSVRSVGGEELPFLEELAADAFDRHGRTTEAFALYSELNAILRGRHAAEFEPVRAGMATARLIEWFETSPSWEARPVAASPTDEPVGHVFVLGFMRSGTTLLETILSTSAKVTGIDEVEFLDQPARAFFLHDGGLDRLATLGEDEARKWRKHYWSAIRDAGLPVKDRIFIDKMPFNVQRLPLIARLFPDARIVFALRDPRDVVWSCFRRFFNPTPWAYEFYRLDDCARFYADTMRLGQIYRGKLPIAVCDHRYEDLVGDFEGAIRRVCAFTGIDWHEGMRDFRAAAESIDRRSASAAQVRRGLYAEGVGQWRRYREQLAPVLPILAPWVKRFGYPAE